MEINGKIALLNAGTGAPVPQTGKAEFIRTGRPGSVHASPAARDVKKTESAMEFERVFARYLVGEMTKESFRPADNNGMPGAGSEFYRDMIVDALSDQLARERRLGFADLIMQFWNRNDDHYEK